MAKTRVQVDGLRDVDKALGELGKSTGKAVLRRVGKKRLQVIADTAKAMAPDDPGTTGKKDLKTSIGVGTKLTRRQAQQHRKMFKDERASVEIFAGAGGLASATQQEFGNVNHGPQPFLRPAWDQHKGGLLEGLKDDLWEEIRKTAARVAKRAAKKGR